MKSPIQKRNHLLSKGYEIIATVSGNSFKAVVFKNDQFYREGEKVYNDWESAITETESLFYERLNK